MQTKKEIFTAILAVLVSVFLVAGITFAVTTIGLNISTDGNLSVGGTLSVTGATTLAGPLNANGGITIPAGQSLSIPAGALSDGSILTADIADDVVTSIKILDGTIVDADVSLTAAIAGTKINPDFGSQNIITTGSLTIGGGTAIARHISATTSITFSLSTPNTCTVATTSISGAALGDVVALGMPEPPTTDYLISFGAWVSAADVVSLKYCTGAATTTDGVFTVRFDVWKH